MEHDSMMLLKQVSFYTEDFTAKLTEEQYSLSLNQNLCLFYTSWTTTILPVKQTEPELNCIKCILNSEQVLFFREPQPSLCTYVFSISLTLKD